MVFHTKAPNIAIYFNTIKNIRLKYKLYSTSSEIYQMFYNVPLKNVAMLHN